MTNGRLHLLSLTYAFPPGVSGRFPTLNQAGHPNETRLAQALSGLAKVSTVGMLAREIFDKLEPRDESIGLEHELLLWDRRPELWHRWNSWRQLRRFYLEKTVRDGIPDVLLVKKHGVGFLPFCPLAAAATPPSVDCVNTCRRRDSGTKNSPRQAVALCI